MQVGVELKNGVQIEGTLKSVDQFLNIKLDDISVVDVERHPHLVRRSRQGPQLTAQLAVRNCFIRGSVVRYVTMDRSRVDFNLLEDASRRGALGARSWSALTSPAENAKEARK